MSDEQINPPQKCQLYRHWDKDGVLLYIGQSLSAVARLSQHSSSPWFYEIANITVETFASVAEAKTAEDQAIATENPKYNIAGKTTKKPTKQNSQRDRPTTNRFRNYIARKHITQAQMAELLGVSQVSVHRYLEKGVVPDAAMTAFLSFHQGANGNHKPHSKPGPVCLCHFPSLRQLIRESESPQIAQINPPSVPSLSTVREQFRLPPVTDGFDSPLLSTLQRDQTVKQRDGLEWSDV